MPRVPFVIFQIIFVINQIVLPEINAIRSEIKEYENNEYRFKRGTREIREKNGYERHRFKRQTNELLHETFSPCEDNFLTLDRFIGLPFEEENYFNATVPLEKYKRYLPHAELEVVINSPATITVDPTVGRVQIITSEVRTFSIRTHSLPSVLNFTVKSTPHRAFPNLERVVLSGKPVCVNPKKWTPTLLGRPVSENEVSNRVFTPEKELQDCGRRQIEGVALVTGSAATESGQWPWHVAVYKNGLIKKYRCGGNIISTVAVLTAAHCTVDSFRPIAASLLTIVTGKYHLERADDNTKEYKVSRVIIHAKFNPRRLKNDIALLKLADHITYGAHAQPVCLWNFKQIAKNFLYGENGTLVGWGSIKPNSNLSETLRSGEMTLVSDTTCLLSYADFYQTFLTDDTFCAGTDRPNGTIACNGDSGGGLVFEMPQSDGSPSWYLRGIVSVSVSRNGSCDPSHYTVFTDSVRYLSWIYDHWD